ncbi:MAG: AAA family ATPase [Armatimonadota bacterium]|nr:AAA family ATPase [Armatimonadota bacterium]MDR7518606.1 AAA family ATPase [Armatimonadota bacterium]MDR7548473.1 AAA family ATPase [Armatimonadota bacterium]
MTITQLRLRRFKKFADWSAAFAPGLTVVRGPNEAGKTTLMEALFEGLFRDPGRGEATARLRSWGEQRLGEITIDLQVRGVRYLLRKDLEAGTILLQSEDGRDRLESPRDVQRRLLEWIGLASEAAYRSTAFVAQGDIARVSEDRRLLSTHLSRILSGAGVETVQQALQWLADQRTRLTAPPPGGRTLAERIADLRAQQTVLRQWDERMQRHRIELREVTRRLEDVEREAAERTELVRVAKWAADLQRREQALIEEEAATRDYLVRAESLLARLSALDADLAEFSTQQEALIAELFHARRQYLQLESNLRAAGQQAEREERTLEHLATRHHNAMRLGSLGWTLAGSGLIGVVGGGLIVALINFHWIGWALLGIGAVVLLIGMRYRGRISEAGADYRNQEQRVLELRRRIEVMQRQLAEAQEMVSTRLQAVGGGSLEDVERRFSRYMDLLREREEVRASLRQIRGADPRAALETRLKEIAEELASVRATMDTLPKAARKGPVAAAEQVEQQARALAAELQALRERRARLEGMLDELRDRGDEGARLEEEIATLQSRLSRERQALEIVELTMRLLEEARSLSVYPARELLERRAGEYLAMATDRAYGRVAVDERALRPQVWVPSAGAWKDASELSQATSDLLYLCLRLALLDVITAERRPPLFLDEPFAHLDEARRRAVLPLLAIAARDRQVVLFTCWPDYDGVAEKVVVLDRAAVP